MKKSRKDTKSLVKIAASAYKNSYSPYSGIRVGAALETSEGKIYTGCNIENASYGLTICAEQVALAKAVSDGSRRFKRIAIAASTGELMPPCGSCRQILYEFSPKLKVLMAGKKGRAKSTPLKKLLPKAFRLKRPIF